MLTDPHILTFDDARYDLYSTGTFLLHQAGDGSHESQVRLWDCSTSVAAVSCVCGLAVREGNSLAILDMCSSAPGTARPALHLSSLTEGEVRVRVLEARGGRVLRLQFASGRSVTAHLETWGMSLTVRTTGADFGHTR